MLMESMNPTTRLIFIHGLEGSSQGDKATLLRGLFPGMLTPDFNGTLDERMAQLNAILSGKTGWTIIGSSLGGLMVAMFASQHPEQVERLILLAPALIWPDFAFSPPAPISVPTTIYHGTQDTLIPLQAVQAVAKKVFLNLTFQSVEDDHGLYHTIHAMDWLSLLNR
jgi:pimeloyl-ACP methyl ester carboxylesterase